MSDIPDMQAIRSRMEKLNLVSLQSDPEELQYDRFFGNSGGSDQESPPSRRLLSDQLRLVSTEGKTKKTRSTIEENGRLRGVVKDLICLFEEVLEYSDNQNEIAMGAEDSADELRNLLLKAREREKCLILEVESLQSTMTTVREDQERLQLQRDQTLSSLTTLQHQLRDARLRETSLSKELDSTKEQVISLIAFRSKSLENQHTTSKLQDVISAKETALNAALAGKRKAEAEIATLRGTLAKMSSITPPIENFPAVKSSSVELSNGGGNAEVISALKAENQELLCYVNALLASKETNSSHFVTTGGGEEQNKSLIKSREPKRSSMFLPPSSSSMTSNLAVAGKKEAGFSFQPPKRKTIGNGMLNALKNNLASIGGGVISDNSNNSVCTVLSPNSHNTVVKNNKNDDILNSLTKSNSINSKRASTTTAKPQQSNNATPLTNQNIEDETHNCIEPTLNISVLAPHSFQSSSAIHPIIVVQPASISVAAAAAAAACVSSSVSPGSSNSSNLGSNNNNKNNASENENLGSKNTERKPVPSRKSPRLPPPSSSKIMSKSAPLSARLHPVRGQPPTVGVSTLQQDPQSAPSASTSDKLSNSLSKKKKLNRSNLLKSKDANSAIVVEADINDKQVNNSDILNVVGEATQHVETLSAVSCVASKEINTEEPSAQLDSTVNVLEHLIMEKSKNSTRKSKNTVEETQQTQPTIVGEQKSHSFIPSLVTSRMPNLKNRLSTTNPSSKGKTLNEI